MLLLGPRHTFFPLPGAAVGMHKIIGRVAVQGIAQISLLEGGSGGGRSSLRGAITRQITHASTLTHIGGRGGRGGVSEANTEQFETFIEASSRVMAIVTAVRASAGHDEGERAGKCEVGCARKGEKEQKGNVSASSKQALAMADLL